MHLRAKAAGEVCGKDWKGLSVRQSPCSRQRQHFRNPGSKEEMQVKKGKDALWFGEEVSPEEGHVLKAWPLTGSRVQRWLLLLGQEGSDFTNELIH